ncbi:protein transport protein Sec24A [Drosophila albomicans]|uniref:Protein transport protein Sec24A n=1 Tax=Drosophila albomicans TaxID=7291 RepID=A0A6P8WZR3_DROAB|nr:protein transport protein Sec24A [Drosophila albomicans]
MSAYNTNFVPPAANGNQAGLVNGQPLPLQPHLQQQQQRQQQLPPLGAPLKPVQFQQPQQQVAAQPTQYPLNATGQIPPATQPQFDSNVMSKFMPPPSALSNGPATIAPPSHLPPQVRPPTLNGPTTAAVISNGSNGALSATSSRTASPGLIPSNYTLPSMESAPAPPPSTVSSNVQFAPGPLGATAVPKQLSDRQLGSPMQPQQQQSSSQLGPTLGATLPPQQQPAAATQPPVSQVTSLASNLQNMNLNPSNSFAPSVTTSLPRSDFRGVATGLAGGVPPLDNIGANALLAASGVVPNMQNPMVTPFNAAVPPSRNPASVFGGQNGPPKAAPKPQQLDNQKVAYGVPPVTSAAEQNNNLQRTTAAAPPSAQRPPQWQPPLNPQLQMKQAFVAQPPLTQAMPSQVQLPPFGPPPTTEKQQSTQPPQQQPTQYPYKHAYPQAMPPQQQQFQPQQQQMPMPPQQQQFPPQPMPPQQQQLQAPGMFGAQQIPSTAPLQYQTQGTTTSTAPLSVAQQGFSRLWGQDTIDLMQNRHILSPATLAPPKVVLHNQFHESINCNPSIIRCTLAKIPESNSLLQKSRLPLGIVIHPFRDVNSLPVIQCMNIVRCRLCRTYINPFVYFVDSKMWKCNLCYRVNELPDDFQFDPATKTYGDVTRRPEVRSSTIEFIAPSEYMLRPPQPAMYLFLFDVSIIAQQSGYLETACAVLNRHLDEMPGDARTQVGFICYDSFVHFYSMAEGLNQPHEMTLLDIDDPFLPRPDSLLVNLKECKELVKDLLKQLPKRFAHTHDPGSALGAALQVAFKLMQASGGRITVFQSCLPNKGPGALEPREDPNNRSAKDVAHLNPATDFYKRYALECSGYQIAVDMFLMNQQYSDMATISGVSKHSGGCVHHFPLYQKTKQHMVDSFRQCFKRYLTRKIGFEAVMRIRCTRGLQVHTFHGNFFVRSTDLLSLPNVNPDAGYGMQISYEESLTDVKTICFQAALLYTNSEGERRIRVHTICLPVTASLPEVMHSADAEAIVGLLSKMAVDRSIASNLSDARDAFINATIDVFNAFKIAQNLPSGQSGQLIAPRSLALLPLYILALLKHPAFRVGTSTRLDDRVYSMDCMKTLPLDQLMKYIYPELYKVDGLVYHARNSNVTQDEDDDEDDSLPEVPRLQLSAEHLDSRSIFLMDCGTLIMLYVGINVPADVLQALFGISSTAELTDYVYGLPNVASTENDVLKRFILRLNYDKPYAPLVQIIRDTSTAKGQFIERLTDDRSESSLSYYEFLQHIRAQVK